MRKAPAPLWARVLSRMLPSRYREEILGDLLEERSAVLAKGRSRPAAAVWLAGHILRSSAASRRRLGVGRATSSSVHTRPARELVLRSVVQDARYTLRLFRRRPGFTLAAVTTLALGIGANVTVFSVARSVLFPALPFPAPDDVVRVFQSFVDRRGELRTSPGLFRAWQSGSADAVSAIAAYRWRRVTLSGLAADASRLVVVETTPGLFDVIGVPPLAGRFLSARDTDEGAHVVVISSQLWRRTLGSDPQIVGRSIRLDDEPWTVVGVMPADVAFPFSSHTDLWTPLVLPANQWALTTALFLDVAARLKPGVSASQAEAAFASITARTVAQTQNAGKITATVVGFRESQVGDLRERLLLLQGVTGIVLLIASVNIANLLLAAATSRRRELSLRVSLGASRGRIVRQLLTEGLMLSLAGSAAGVILAAWAAPALVAAYPADVPQYQPVSVGVADVMAALLLAAATTCVFSLAPILASARGGAAEAMKGFSHTEGSRRMRLVRAVLVGAEVALAVTLVVGGGLLVRSYWVLTNQPIGFDPGQSITTTVTVPEARYPTPGERRAFFAALIERAGNLPGVITAGAASRLPFDLSGSFGGVNVDLGGGQIRRVLSSNKVVSGDFFHTLGIPIVRGRAFTPADDAAGEPVAIVSESLARSVSASGDVVGLRVKSLAPNAPWMVVVGVTADVRAAYRLKIQPELYVPLEQSDSRDMTLVLRTAGGAASLEPGVHDAMRGLDPNLPFDGVRTYHEIIRASVETGRFNMVALVVLASFATLLAALGVAGTMAYVVSLRTREIGIRLALGARARRVQRLIVRQGLVPVAAGLGAGLLGSWWLAGVLRSELFEITAHDPITLAAAAVFFFVVGALACWWPAARASQVDPAITLRSE